MLAELSDRYFWGSSFAGAFYYADDIVLLAPCVSALRTMLDIFAHLMQFLTQNSTDVFACSPYNYVATATIFFDRRIF